MRFKRPQKILKNFGLLWQALRKFNDDNGFFLSSGITFNILINLIPFILFAIGTGWDLSLHIRPSGGPLCEPALGTGQTSFRLVCHPSRRVLYFLWLIKYLGHFRFVGVLLFDDSRCGRGVCLFLGRRSTEIDGLKGSKMEGPYAFIETVGRSPTGSLVVGRAKI